MAHKNLRGGLLDFGRLHPAGDQLGREFEGGLNLSVLVRRGVGDKSLVKTKQGGNHEGGKEKKKKGKKNKKIT